VAVFPELVDAACRIGAFGHDARAAREGVHLPTPRKHAIGLKGRVGERRMQSPDLDGSFPSAMSWPGGAKATSIPGGFGSRRANARQYLTTTLAFCKIEEIAASSSSSRRIAA
jgi:hypothetical protein